MQITFVLSEHEQQAGEIRYDARTDLIMLYGPAICAQWDCKHVGVELRRVSATVLKMAFLCLGAANHYQSFYISSEQAKPLTGFFRGLRFPLPDMPNEVD